MRLKYIITPICIHFSKQNSCRFKLDFSCNTNKNHISQVMKSVSFLSGILPNFNMTKNNQFLSFCVHHRRIIRACLFFRRKILQKVCYGPLVKLTCQPQTMVASILCQTPCHKRDIQINASATERKTRAV